MCCVTTDGGNGAAYIYELFSTTWTQTNVLSGVRYGEYGYAVGVGLGNHAVISAPGIGMCDVMCAV